MNNAILPIVKRIKDDANSLQAFASQIISTHPDADHKARMLEGVLLMLKNLQDLHAELMQPPRQSAGHSYTSLTGEIITVETLEWLEDGWYWEFNEDFDDDGFESGDNYPCSRYAIGVDENGDGISVWLNDDMQEVAA